MFAESNAAIIPCVWIFFPETSKRSLEEINLYFAKAHSEGMLPVKMAREMSNAVGLNTELSKTFGANDVESSRRRSLMRRQSSSAAAACQTQ